MPNWACGSVTVTGNAQNIKDFLSHFIFNKRDNTGAYFARSFSEEYFDQVMSGVDKCAAGNQEDCFSYRIDVEFAWSAHTCIIDGYPHKSDSNCITLEEACALHHVSAEIYTEECGMCFAEHIICTPEGLSLEDCVDLVSYKCRNCGNIQGISPFWDLDDAECCECGCYGDDNWEECSGEAEDID